MLPNPHNNVPQDTISLQEGQLSGRMCYVSYTYKALQAWSTWATHVYNKKANFYMD
jgi:hypothetical protein